MEYTAKQVENIIVNQLTDSERSAILCYLTGWMTSSDNPEEFTKAVNSALKLGYPMVKSKITA